MKLVREHINEKFTEDSDPIKDMGIGTDHYIYNIEKCPDSYSSYEFESNTEKIKKLIRKYNQGISSNEIERFLAFTMQEIYDNIDHKYFETNNLKAIDALIEHGIASESRGWMGMHSDKAMKTM